MKFYLNFILGARRAYHDTGNFKPASMNELPVPCGSWQEHYNKKQAKYNVHLLAGVAFAVLTLVVAKSSGLVYLNYSPPKSLD